MEDYVLEHVLTKDTYGIVCKVVHKKTSNAFAMNIYDSALMPVERQHALHRELEILLPMHHPNIDNIHDFYTEDDLLYVVHDLTNGQDLYERIMEKGHFSEEDAAPIIQVVLETVRDCHALGIIHRNLKPESIIITDSSEIKLSNFRLATYLSGELTSICGSPDYIAPEILANSSRKTKIPYGKEVDVWSLGVVTYVLLSGMLPFWGKDNQELFQAIQTGRFSLSSKPWSAVSATAKDFVSSMLVVDPKKRANIEDMLRHPWLAASLCANAKNEGGGLKIPRNTRALRKMRAAALTVHATLQLKRVFCSPLKEKLGQNKSDLIVKVNEEQTSNIDKFFQKYKFHEVLQDTKFGVTRRVTDLSTQEDYAMTSYSKELMTLEEEIELNTMVDILRRVKHPNILQLHDFFVNHDEYSLVMELSRDGDLFESVMAKRFYMEDEARIVMKNLLQAVAHCHELQIIHRNIKLESVMMNNSLDQIKLANFGKTTQVGPDVTEVCGSHDYIAPEIIANLDKSSPYGVAADIWSLGVLAFVVLCGIQSGQFEFDSPYWDDVSNSAKEFISSMLVTDPNKRPSAVELLQHAWILNLNPDDRYKLNGDAHKNRLLMRRKFKAAVLSVKSVLSLKRSISFASKYSLSSPTDQHCFCKSTGRCYSLYSFEKSNASTIELYNLKRKAALLRSLKHSFILHLEDFINEENCAYFVMEHTTGGDLFDRIAQKACYDEFEARRIVKAILEAVDYCHKRNIVHANLKPESVWFESPLDSASIKLTNFGEVSHNSTKSIDYIAPETLFRPRREDDEDDNEKPMDVWSIGVLTYVLLCGYLPFNGHSNFDLFKNIKRGKFDFKSKEWDAISNEAKHFISKALIVDPEARASVEKLLQDPWMTMDNVPSSPLLATIEKIQALNAKRKCLGGSNL
ncbi:hypothetical protein AeRB84_011263 [Aphanomyces euteiches]|nr:hypothetical protein AeRB84_011263 [Aphanomyces euteiches]